MNLEQLLPPLDALASSLLGFATLEIVYSTLLCLFVLALASCLRGRLPMLQYCLWALVLLRLVLPTSLASPWSLRSFLAGSQVSVMEGALPIWEANHATPELSTLPDRHPTASWRPVVLVTWLAGVLFFASVITRRLFIYRKLIRTARPIGDAKLLSRLRWWRASFRIRRRVRLVTSDASLLPFTLGTLRPVIFLPQALLRHAEPTVTDAVIAHEMAHIQRWDDLWLRFQNFVQVLYFFHPVVWIAASRMNDERERVCDEMVLSRNALSPHTYGRSLLAVLGLGLGLRGRQSVPVASFANDKKRRFSMRIRYILNEKRVPRPLLSLTLALALALLILPMADSGAHELRVESAPFPALRMTHPLPQGKLTSGFGERTDPFNGQTVDHPGIDIAARAGVDVLAPADGTVEIAETKYSGGTHLGTVIIIDHGNGLKTFYAHLGNVGVEPGQSVRGQEPIAKVGSTGESTGPHLHFEVWESGNPVDPLRFVTR